MRITHLLMMSLLATTTLTACGDKESSTEVNKETVSENKTEQGSEAQENIHDSAEKQTADTEKDIEEPTSETENTESEGEPSASKEMSEEEGNEDTPSDVELEALEMADDVVNGQ